MRITQNMDNMINTDKTADRWHRMAAEEAIDALGRVPAMDNIKPLLTAAACIVNTVPNEGDRVHLAQHCGSRFGVSTDDVLGLMGKQARESLMQKSIQGLPTIAPEGPSPFDALPFQDVQTCGREVQTVRTEIDEMLQASRKLNAYLEGLVD